jgi:hypothetical protein
VIVARPELLHIEFYPETGLLIPDVLNRVYFQAFTSPSKEIVSEIENAVLKELGGTTVLSDINTAHRGKGKFEFTPEFNTNYKLVFVAPNGDVVERNLVTLLG